MSHERTIKVEALTRVEGEGGLYIRLNGERIEDVKLSIYEPPRFFEAFLKERPLEEVPDITARICGICPVAYQMSACTAIEEMTALPWLARPDPGPSPSVPSASSRISRRSRFSLRSSTT